MISQLVLMGSGEDRVVWAHLGEWRWISLEIGSEMEESVCAGDAFCLSEVVFPPIQEEFKQSFSVISEYNFSRRTSQMRGM